MKIKKCLNTTKAEIQKKKFNICIGISLGNKYFTPKHIRAYILWALKNTKEKVAVLIPDKIHAINYEVKNGYSPTRATAVARRKGDEVEKIVEEIRKGLKIEKSRLHIVRWVQIQNASHMKMLHIFQNAFEDNMVFREAVINITKETPHIQKLNLSDSQYEKLSQYVVEGVSPRRTSYMSFA
jgi:tRNA-dependent cyclodipeptide synthase